MRRRPSLVDTDQPFVLVSVLLRQAFAIIQDAYYRYSKTCHTPERAIPNDSVVPGGRVN